MLNRELYESLQDYTSLKVYLTGTSCCKKTRLQYYITWQDCPCLDIYCNVGSLEYIDPLPFLHMLRELRDINSQFN